MTARPSNAMILDFLKKSYPGTGFIDSLKIKYRPLICPFADIISLAKPGDKVGDVGCGSGQFLLLMSHFAQPSQVYGIEISEKLINNANQLFAKQPFRSFAFSTYDGVHFPPGLREMDILYLIDVLHHVPKPNQENFIKDLAAIMKPGARLVLKDIDGGSGLVMFNKMHDMVFAGEIGNEISFKKAKEWLTAAGLKIISENKKRMYVYPHYTIVAEKK